MNEQLYFDLGQQRHAAGVKRAEANCARLAISLVSLAARLQPSLAITVQCPAQPATA